MMHLLASSRLSGDERVEETRTGCTRGRARAEAHRDAVERYRTGRAHRPVDARVRPRAFERVNERPAHE